MYGNMNDPVGKAWEITNSDNTPNNGWQINSLQNVQKMRRHTSPYRYHTELYYHIVWGTYNRHPMLHADVQPDIYRYLVSKCADYNYELYAVNGMEDHIHLALRLHPSVRVSDVINKLKGGSAHFCNRTIMPTSPIRWQGGYGAFTFGKRDLPIIVSYIQHQKQRHLSGHLQPNLERSH